MKKFSKIISIGYMIMLGLTGCSQPSSTASTKGSQHRDVFQEQHMKSQVYAPKFFAFDEDLLVPMMFECNPSVDQTSEHQTLFNRLDELPLDDTKSSEWLELIKSYVEEADLGSCEAFQALGEIYYHDFDLTAKDLAENVEEHDQMAAKPYLEVGAELGHPKAELYLGHLMLNSACDSSAVGSLMTCIKKLEAATDFYKRAAEHAIDDEELYQEALTAEAKAHQQFEIMKQNLINMGDQWYDAYVETKMPTHLQHDLNSIYENLQYIKPLNAEAAFRLNLQKQLVLKKKMLISFENERSSIQAELDKVVADSKKLFIEMSTSDIHDRNSIELNSDNFAFNHGKIKQQPINLDIADCDLNLDKEAEVRTQYMRLDQKMGHLIAEIDFLSKDALFTHRNQLVKEYTALARKGSCNAFYGLSLIQKYLFDTSNAKPEAYNYLKAMAYARVASNAGLEDASLMMSFICFDTLHPEMTNLKKNYALKSAILWANRAYRQTGTDNVAGQKQVMDWKNFLQTQLDVVESN